MRLFRLANLEKKLAYDLSVDRESGIFNMSS